MLGQANGCMLPAKAADTLKMDENTIIIKSTLDYAHAAKTLAHEMAHVVAEHGKVTNYHSEATARAACEAIAEGAAFVVMSPLRIATRQTTQCLTLPDGRRIATP